MTKADRITKLGPVLLSMDSVTKRSPIPLYFQIAEAIRRQIEAGDVAQGARIPTEKDLEEIFDVSRTTVRQALADLEREGLLERRRGQGTYVRATHRRFDEPVLGIRSYTQEAIKQGFSPSAELLSLTVLIAPAEVRGELKLQENEEVHLVRRLRFLDREPMGIDSTYVPVTLTPGLSAADFSTKGDRQSLYFVLEQKYGHVLEEAEEIIDAAVTTEEESRLLGVAKDTPINLRKRVVYLPDGTPLLYMNALYKNRYRIRLKRGLSG